MQHDHFFPTRLLAAALLLAGAVSACQKAPQVEDNPTYDPVNRTVNTQFIVNISTGTGSPDTKQTAANTQQSFADFRGIEAAHVLAYTLGYTGVNGEYYMYKPSLTSSQATRDFDLGTLVTTGDIQDEDRRRIIELALPLETNAIMIYGRAPKTGTNEEQGYVDYSGTALNSTLDNVKFQLHTRLKDDNDINSFKQTGDLFGRILTGIMNAGRVQESTDNGYAATRNNTYAFWWPIDETSLTFETTGNDGDTHEGGYTLYKGSQTWKQYGDAYRENPAGMTIALEAALGEAYAEVMYLKGSGSTTELRAGSAAAVVRMVNDMYNVIQRVRNATPTIPQEYIAQLVAEEAFTRAGRFFTYDASSQTMNFKTRSDIMTAVNTYIPGKTESDYTNVPESAFYYKKISESDTRTEYPGFPINLGLPLGSAVMTFFEPSGASYRVVQYGMDIPAYGMGDGNLTFNVMNYCFPAELVYYTNSSIRTSEEVAVRTDFPATPGSWANSENWTGKWSGKKVTSTTRSVAVSKPINYGTALLKTEVAYGSNEIEDNNEGVHTGEANNKILVNGSNRPFLVSGVIIGGVDRSVGWDFLPNGEGFNCFVYDNFGGQPFAIPAYVSETLEYSTPVYTCTWDNYNKAVAVDAQNKVYIGLELVNNTGQDIWGELNLIRNGGTFYLVGELDPTQDVAGKVNRDNLKKNNQIDLSRSDFFYPPFDEDGNTINAPRVFMQDYMTTAKFVFGKESLKHAYVTMPDLRSGQVSLGLSVDLEWQSGMEFTSELGNVSYN